LIGIQRPTSNHVRKDDAEDETESEVIVVPEEGDDDLRQRVIARVDDLRTSRQMTKQELDTLIGPPAAQRWTAFVTASADEAWNHVTTRMFDRIAEVLGIGSSELLRSR
jgi:hypothetical protein